MCSRSRANGVQPSRVVVAAGTFLKAGLYWVVLGAGLAALIGCALITRTGER
jgi:hypothetical protein